MWTAAYFLVLSAAPWELVPLADGAATLGVRHHGALVQSIGRNGETATVSLRLDDRISRRRLLVALYDADRRPVAGAVTDWLAPGDTELTLELPGEAAFAACGIEQRPQAGAGSLVSAAAGGSVVECSTCYGGSYGPGTLIDGGPSCWASATGKIAGEWFIVQLPAEQMVAAIGIDPTGEPSYRTCAVRDWRLLASTDGTIEGDFQEVLTGTCEDRDELQRFELPEPVPARYLKLVMLTNRGNDRWMELTEFEAYAPAGDVPPDEPTVEPLVSVIEDFDAAPQPPPQGRESDIRLLDGRLAEPLMQARELPMRMRDLVEPPAGGQGVVVHRVNCGQATFTYASDGEGDTRRTFGRFEFDFGNLLGGAPQYCAAILGRELPPGTARVQLAVRAGQTGNLLRSTVWDSGNEWFLYQYEKITRRGWHAVSIDLDPAKAVMHGGETRDGRLDGPLRLMQVSLNPGGRETVRGTVDIDGILALRQAP